MQALLSITNLLLAHVAITFEYFTIAALLLTVALLAMLSLFFCQKTICKTSIIIGGLCITGLLVFFLDSRQITYFPPLLIHFFLFLFFSSSVISDNTPIITRFARLISGDLSAATEDYTRKASIAWSIFMFLLFCEAVIIAYIAPIETWSLFVNFINYLFLMLMFVAEFMVRRIVLKDENQTSFLSFVKSLAKVDMKKVISKS